MSIQERLEQDMKEAMKAREAGRVRLSVIRMVRAALKNAEIAQGRSLGDEDTATVLRKELKQRQESLAGFEQAGRVEQAAVLRDEIAVLEGYLPAGLSNEEIESLVREVIAEVGATSMRDMGKVMSALMPRVRGRADGGQVNAVVKSILSA